MKIFYNRRDILPRVKETVESDGFSAEYKFKGDLFKPIKTILGIPKGVGTGACPPEGWINFSENVINFVISDEILKGVLAAAVWETIKKIFSLVKKNQKDKNDRFVVITDEYESSNFRKTIYFVAYAHEDEGDILEGIQKIPEVREKIIDLLNVADFGSMGVIRLTYYMGKWRIS